MHYFRKVILLSGLLLSCGQLIAGDLTFFAFSPESDISTLGEKLENSRNSYRNNSSDETLAVSYAMQLHEYTAAAQEEKVKPSLKELEKISDQFPQNHLLMALKASTLCMSARDTWFIPSKISRVNRCIKSLDNAVNSSNKDTQVLAIRAGNSIRLPERFKRRELAIDDINYLLDSGDLEKIDIENIDDRLITQLVVLLGDAQKPDQQKTAYQRLQSKKPDAYLLKIADEAML